MEISPSNSAEIMVENLQMQIPPDRQTFTEALLVGEIADLKIEHKAFLGPIKETITLLPGHTTLLLLVSGKGRLSAGSIVQSLTPDSIVVPIADIPTVQIEVERGKELHFLQFTKKLSTQDLKDLTQFPKENRQKLYATRFEDCEPYTEKIKSPNTISRTVLPANIIPRVSLGTVEAIGPDKVGAHKHPMLEQLFLGLTDNDVMVYADQVSTKFKQYSLLHIPLGSTHWVEVAENKKMNYMWMDFFLTKEGEEWLKTHKPINTNQIMSNNQLKNK